jgi:flagellar hook-length control protein FliK
MINLTLNSTAQAAQAAPIAAGNGAASSPQNSGAALPFADRPIVAPAFADLLGQLDVAGADGTADAPAAADSTASPVSADDDGDDSDAGQQPVLTAAMTMSMPMLSVALAAANAVATAGGRQAESDAQEQPATTAAVATAAPARAIPAAVAMALPAVADQAPHVTPPIRPGADPVASPDASATGATRAVAAAIPANTGDLATSVESATAGDGAIVTGAALGPAPAAQRDNGADTVALPGPPSAWRQNLHEALGERLQLQAGRGLEQAVIRLDPPQLGRIEIAIRHTAGSLEVTLSATHGEVLRQLHAVSDNLRNDLAQRQYAEVAVTVTPAPRNAAANPFGADAQGRGRQGGREQEQQAPGLALFDDGPAASAFSLTGRE